jgi:hypothetical protein
MISKKELKVVTLLAMVIAITSVAQLGFQSLSYYDGQTLVPPIIARIILTVMFWTSFIFIFVAINMYRKI